MTRLTFILSMNRPFGVPALAGPDRLKAELRTESTPKAGSWAQCAALLRPWRLSMNLTAPSSRGDEVKVAVGFNPRLAAEAVPAVAERRLNAVIFSNPSCVAQFANKLRKRCFITTNMLVLIYG